MDLIEDKSKIVPISDHDGRRNNKGRGSIQHGAYSSQVRRRYTDLRTTEGRQLKNAIDGIVEDLGGMENLSNAQRLILDGIKGKLIVLFQIGKYVDKTPSLVDENGALLTCLSKSYVQYTESIRRDVEALYGIHRKQRKNQSYRDAVRSLGK